GQLPGETLRLWESPHAAVVLGRSSPAAEVDLAACQAAGIPIVRRASGGATVLLGPGCLAYAVVLDRRTRPELAGVDGAHDLALGRLAAALAALVPGIVRAGTSDLALV
ncbi:MAG TPA: lipoate--protein ligase family protein, partial [Lacipirellulaceae bacterium]|nr:lipoate--protein ligase family protein [Lacipirellulaceae bacterium]